MKSIYTIGTVSISKQRGQRETKPKDFEIDEVITDALLSMDTYPTPERTASLNPKIKKNKAPASSQELRLEWISSTQRIELCSVCSLQQSLMLRYTKTSIQWIIFPLVLFLFFCRL